MPRKSTGRPGGSVFHHQSAPDVSRLPTGAYLVRRNMVSIEGYLVFDSTDAEVYRFKGHLAFPAQRWSMLDAGGSEVATLVRPPLHIHPTFTVSRPGRSDVVIRKASFSPVLESWRIEGAEDGDVDLRGDVLNHEFTFEQDGRAVGTTTRRWISLTDAYAVQVAGMDPVLAIAAAVGIDSVEREREH
jgi:uncharacterized protein YxjI